VTSNFKHLAVSHTPQGALLSLQSHVLKLELIRELGSFMSSLASDLPSRLVIAGNNGFFAAGADISELTSLTGPEATEYARLGQRTFNAIASLPVITIAAIDGFCMGGGLDLALSCSCRYATSKSVLAHPGGRIGIMTGWGGTQRLPLIIGKSRALEMMAIGRRLTAAEALDWQLIDRIVEDPVAEAFNNTKYDRYKRES